MSMKKVAAGSIVFVAIVIVLVIGIYIWGFCRFYVPPGKMAIVTSKTGTQPPPGTILVERGQKGIWAEVLPEGRHFLDPVSYDVKIVNAVNIPLGKVGIVTSKVGKDLSSGDIIAADRSEKGVWRNVLGPGLYRLNPQGYNIDIVDAINIPIGYVGVVTSQTGATAKPGEFASVGEKGVFKDILQPGLYYINTRAYQVNVIEIGMNQVSMTGGVGSVVELRRNISTSNALNDMAFNTLNAQLEQRMNESNSDGFVVVKSDELRKEIPQSRQLKSFSNVAQMDMAASKAAPAQAAGKDKSQRLAVAAKSMDTATVLYGENRFVEFPSRDGFKIQLDMTVEFELLPGNIAKIYMLYGDLPQVVEKILIPQIMSASRLKGSTYKAQDFIMGEGRETFQNNLKGELVNAMEEKSLIIHNAIIRNVEIPANILQPIRDSSMAKEQNLTNHSLQETAKIEADLNTQTAMIKQKRMEVEQETRKMVAEINANQKNAVQKILAQASLDVADIQLQRSQILAKTQQLKGEAEVKRRFMLENEQALGTRKKSEVLGALGIMADLKLIETLNDDVKVNVIYAGEGTLWTDMKSGSIAVPAASASAKK